MLGLQKLDQDQCAAHNFQLQKSANARRNSPCLNSSRCRFLQRTWSFNRGRRCEVIQIQINMGSMSIVSFLPIIIIMMFLEVVLFSVYRSFLDGSVSLLEDFSDTCPIWSPNWELPYGCHQELPSAVKDELVAVVDQALAKRPLNVLDWLLEVMTMAFGERAPWNPF